ncbi:hypothetical protein BDV11DRAFT_176479 [Aspergillus similis]
MSSPKRRIETDVMKYEHSRLIVCSFRPRLTVRQDVCLLPIPGAVSYRLRMAHWSLDRTNGQS